MIEIETPDGTLYITIFYDSLNGRPFSIKSYFDVDEEHSNSKWLKAFDGLINLSLEMGAGVNDIIEALQYSNKHNTNGPENLVIAFNEFKKNRFRELKNSLESVD